MKKSIYLFAITAIFFIVGYNVYIKTIDTKYAVKFAQAFKNYDINDIDKYFSKDTQFIYKENKKTYNELRKNIEKACNEKIYEFSDGSSYGYGNDKFINNLQTVNVKLHGKISQNSFGDCSITMILRKKGLFSFAVDSLECNEDVFGQMFFN